MRTKNVVGIGITKREKPREVTRRGPIRLRGSSDYWCYCHILQLADASAPRVCNWMRYLTGTFPNQRSRVLSRTLRAAFCIVVDLYR